MLQYQSDHLMLISEVSLLQEQLFLEVNCSDILNAPYKNLSLAVVVTGHGLYQQMKAFKIHILGQMLLRQVTFRAFDQ